MPSRLFWFSPVILLLLLKWKSRNITKHLMSGRSGDPLVLFSLESWCFPRLRLAGKHQDFRENKTNCFPRDLTLSVYGNMFEEEECRQTISYLQGYSCPNLYCKKLSNQKPTAKTVRNTRRTTLCWVRVSIPLQIGDSPSTVFPYLCANFHKSVSVVF